MRALHVDDIRSEAGQQPGAIESRSLDGTVHGFAIRCPCGCGLESWLPVHDNGRGWDWDGNLAEPTLTPSVLHRTCGWHGYLTAGEWRAC